MKVYILPIVAAVLLLSVGCCCCSWTDDTSWNWDEWWQRYVTVEPPYVTPAPPPTPAIVREPLPPEAAETAQLLQSTTIPTRDLHELAVRLLGLPADTPRTTNAGGSPDYAVGTRRVFHVSNVDTDEQFDITAVLAYRTPHVYMWVEEGERVDEDTVRAAADLFEEHTYPTNRAFFGSEWTPGVDNDPHVSILHAHNLGSVGGYYSSSDEAVTAVRADSNEMEMFYISLDYERIGSDEYNGVLAHEFQHMIQWYNDRNEEGWVSEGLSELTYFINGFGGSGSDYSFAVEPDTQLNTWPEDSDLSFPHYGASYLFISYFLDQLGEDATRALAASPENGFATVDLVLADLGTGLTHEDFFANWVIANLLDDPSIYDGQYGYEDIDPPDFSIDTRLGPSNYPYSTETTVNQYATDYIRLEGSQPLLFSFTGSTQTGLMNTQAHSGQYLWWSNRGDLSDMTLTRAFDLSGVQNATLEFYTWYDIEEDWDYAYVEASIDGGQTWTILTTPSGTLTNPNGNSFGWGYTGRSGGWIQERVDLSLFTGQEVMIRFEYITDDAVNRPGFALDDVAIPEIGYFSDFEADGDDWEPAGFIRHANVLPQEWVIQLVLYDRNTVQPLQLNDDQTGQWEIPLGGDVQQAVVVISALAPVTTEPASYYYTVAYR